MAIRDKARRVGWWSGALAALCLGAGQARGEGPDPAAPAGHAGTAHESPARVDAPSEPEAVPLEWIAEIMQDREILESLDLLERLELFEGGDRFSPHRFE